MSKCAIPWTSVVADTVLVAQSTDNPARGCTAAGRTSEQPANTRRTAVPAIGCESASRTVTVNAPAGSGTPFRVPTTVMKSGAILVAGAGGLAAAATPLHRSAVSQQNTWACLIVAPSRKKSVPRGA